MWVAVEVVEGSARRDDIDLVVAGEELHPSNAEPPASAMPFQKELRSVSVLHARHNAESRLNIDGIGFFGEGRTLQLYVRLSPAHEATIA